jgi:serine/threonine protein kinase
MQQTDQISYEFSNFLLFEEMDPTETLIGQIFDGRHMKSGEKVKALKIFKSTILAEEQEKFEIFKNLTMMLQYYVPESPIEYITKVYCTHETESLFYVIHEDWGGESLEQIFQYRSGVGFDEEDTIKIIYEVLKALEITKTFKMPHGGVYPSNIYEKNNMIRLGLPNFRKIPGQVKVRKRVLDFNAPEPAQTAKSDLWSVGLLIVDLMKGRPKDYGAKGIKHVVSISYDARELIAYLVKADPKDRMGLRQLKAHRVIFIRGF